LLIGFLLSMLLFPKFNKETLTGWIGDGISAAAPILLITGAGGAFGTILKEVQIGDTLGNLLAGYQLGIFLPFIIAAAFKTAQGSSTVALIATSALIAPLLINHRTRFAIRESTGCNGNRSRCNDDFACQRQLFLGSHPILGDGCKNRAEDTYYGNFNSGSEFNNFYIPANLNIFKMNKLTFFVLFALAFQFTSCENIVEIDGIVVDFNNSGFRCRWQFG
jgi:hypothetical protein